MWIVWRPCSPDPSRLSPAIHYEDPKKDRDTSNRLAVMMIAQEHRGMSIRELTAIKAYNIPATPRTSIEGDTTKTIEVRPPGGPPGEARHGG